MCGIYGCIGKSNIEITRNSINKIKHRGPDAIGIRKFEGAYLAHARLSIIDTSDAADQPMTDSSGRYTIIYNGEVYNYIEIRKELELLGYHFRTNGDTEVVLYAYIAWGNSFQEKCNGMWAIAIWDDIEKSLFLGRDRFGIKPLYYYEENGNFYFASEMKALFPVMSDIKINYSVFDTGAYFRYEATEDSIFRNIHKIKAGNSAVYKNGTLSVQRWWNTLEHIHTVPITYEQQVEALRELFEDACAIRMRSDVPIGTALSGGVDSSAVVGFMRHIQDRGGFNKEWRNAFVASMPGTAIDETRYAEIAAEYAGWKINRVMITPDISPEKLLEYMYLCEDPYISNPIPYMQTYGKIAEKGIKVTLDGHGADELFGGYSFDVLDAVSADSSEHEMRNAYEVYMNMLGASAKKLSIDEFKKILQQNKSIRINKRYGNLDGLNSKLYYETHEAVLPTLLRLYDHFGMSNGVEIRMPFMDYRIVTFAFSIPWTSKLRDGFGKKIVRDMAQPYMFEKIIYRKDKIGFNPPMTEWLMESTMKEFILDLIASRDFMECGIVNPLQTKILVNEFYKKDKPGFSDGEAIWVAVMPYIWEKAMGV